jgi:mRNA interferase MazF
MMGNTNPGEIYWAEFEPPRSGSIMAHPRPVLIIQAAEELNNVRVVIPFSSRNEKYRRYTHVHFVQSTPENGLSKDSTVLVFQILLIDSNRLKNRLGRLSNSDLQAVRSKLRIFLGL